MFAHAASYFGDPEAQYQLGAALSRRQRRRRAKPSAAVPWLVLAANKGHYKSQALLGRILFKGEHGTAPARLGPDVADLRLRRAGRQVAWIAELRETAFKQATDDERAMALHPAQALGERERRRRDTLAAITQRRCSDRQIDPRPARGRTASPRSGRACRCRAVSRSAACGDSSRWSMRMPLFFCQAPA